MYKLLVDPAGFINIVTYSVDSQEPNIIVSRIEDPFSVIKYLSVFRESEDYQPFHISKTSESLTQSGSYFLLYWVKLCDGVVIVWNIDEKGKYISQQPVLEKNILKELWSNLVWFNFPGYKNITKKLEKDIFSQLEKQKDTLSNNFLEILKLTKFLNEKPILEMSNGNFSIINYFQKFPELHKETVYINLKDFPLIEKNTNKKNSEYLGSLDIYKEIATIGDLVYFTSKENHFNKDQELEWQKVENLLLSDQQRSNFYTQLKLISCHENIKYSIIRLITGYAWCKCPFTGKILKSNRSFIIKIPSSISKYIAYYFDSIYPFFLLSYGGWISNNFAIYLPFQNICITFNLFAQWGNQVVIKHLISLFNSYQDLVTSYLQQNNKKKCLVIDAKNNLGHYIWQDLSGLSLIFDETNFHKYLEYYLVNPDNRYKEQGFEPENVFPELKNYYSFTNGNETEIALRENLFLFKIEDIIISEFLPPRIHAISSQIKHSLLEKLTQEKAIGKLILMINLRSHNKIWVNAVEVLSDLLISLDKERELVIVYDGFKDIKPLIDSLIKNTEQTNIIHLDCTELKLLETFAIVKLIDCFICPIGSGLVIPTWIHDKPGIAHADKMHLKQKTHWKYATPKGYDSDAVIWLEESEINFLEGDKFYGNYEINTEVIMKKIKTILNQN
jgi:hypothetical protein